GGVRAGRFRFRLGGRGLVLLLVLDLGRRGGRLVLGLEERGQLGERVERRLAGLLLRGQVRQRLGRPRRRPARRGRSRLARGWGRARRRGRGALRLCRGRTRPLPRGWATRTPAAPAAATPAPRRHTPPFAPPGAA